MLLLRSGASVVAILGLLFTSAQADGVLLNAQSIKNLFPGQYEARFKGYKVVFSAHRDGRLVGQAFGKEDRGKWFLRGNQACMTWKKWTEGKPECGSISRQGNWLVANNKNGQMLKFRPVPVVAQTQQSINDRPFATEPDR